MRIVVCAVTLGLMIPDANYIAEKSLVELTVIAVFLIRIIGPQQPLQAWWKNGGKNQVELEERLRIEACLQIWKESELPEPIRRMLGEIEAHCESLWEGGGLSYSRGTLNTGPPFHPRGGCF